VERARPSGAPPEEPALVTPASAYSARYHHGRALAVARRYQEALPELMAAAQLQPSATDPHYALGIAYKESGRIGEAIGAFARALEIDPTFLDGYMTLADVLCEAGKLDTAEQVLQQAQSLFPDSGPVHDKLAAVYLEKNDYPRVIEALQGQVRIEPENESASVNLATCAILIGDYATAAEAIDSLLRRDPSSWRGHHLRSMLYDAADKVELAIEELREAARLAPWEWKPFNDLGTLLNARARTDRKTADEAVEVLEKAVTLAPADELAPRYNLGLAYWNAGRRIEARSTLDEMIRTGPPDDRLVQQAREAASAMDAELGKQPGQDVDPPP
jgi:tetratricopeptide (TPR) repeat protein